MNGTKLPGLLSNVGWARRVIRAVTHPPCRQAHLKQTRCVAAQRLVGYAKNANPPYIELNLVPFIRASLLRCRLLHIQRQRGLDLVVTGTPLGTLGGSLDRAYADALFIDTGIGH